MIKPVQSSKLHRLFLNSITDLTVVAAYLELIFII